MVLSTGINFISDVVGTKAKTGAFVFGCYSLLDKFSAGIVIFLVGSAPAYEAKPQNLTDDERNFIKYTIILIPMLSCILAAVIVLTYPIQEYAKPKKSDSTRRDSLEDELVVWVRLNKERILDCLFIVFVYYIFIPKMYTFIYKIYHSMSTFC